jgi:acyl carrier protein
VTETEIRRILAEVAAEQLGGAMLPEGDLAASLDSMQRLALVVAVEDRFGVAFEPEDDAAVRTTDDLVAVLVRRLGA